MKFKRSELPIVHSMTATVRRIRPRRDGSHFYQKYFLFWTAFQNIYTTIAHRKGLRPRMKKNADGSIVALPNGNVHIPQVETVSEREQIYISIDEFNEPLKHSLILHGSTQFFVNRVPYWQGTKIEYDHFGQRVNGVIHVNHTSDAQYPVWSPIDLQYYEAYMENPDEGENRNFLVRQIVALLYAVRNNFMHGSQKLDDANDIQVVENALPLLELIVTSFAR